MAALSAEQYRRIKAARGLVMLGVLSTSAWIVVTGVLDMRRDVSDWLTASPLAVLATGLVAEWRVDCPMCTKPFFRGSIGYRNPFASRCVHCRAEVE